MIKEDYVKRVTITQFALTNLLTLDPLNPTKDFRGGNGNQLYYQRIEIMN